MGDNTGAPWNIPYVEPSDLVRDYPAADEAQALAIAAGLDAAGNAGIGSNVVQTVMTDTFDSTSTSFVTITGLSATITPTSADSKILLIAQFVTSQQAALVKDMVFYRFSGGNATDYVGDADGSRSRAAIGQFTQGDDLQYVQSMVFLDSPNTTSAVTYNVEGRRQSANVFTVNRPQNDADDADVGRFASSITAIEVKA